MKIKQTLNKIKQILKKIIKFMKKYCLFIIPILIIGGVLCYKRVESYDDYIVKEETIEENEGTIKEEKDEPEREEEEEEEVQKFL